MNPHFNPRTDLCSSNNQLQECNAAVELRFERPEVTSLCCGLGSRALIFTGRQGGAVL